MYLIEIGSDYSIYWLALLGDGVHLHMYFDH